jgi:hypothetical protein
MVDNPNWTQGSAPIGQPMNGAGWNLGERGRGPRSRPAPQARPYFDPRLRAMRLRLAGALAFVLALAGGAIRASM